jgi:hypothetical protein
MAQMHLALCSSRNAADFGIYLIDVKFHVHCVMSAYDAWAFFCNALIIVLRLHIFLLQLLLGPAGGVKPKTAYKVWALSARTGMGGGVVRWSYRV